MKLEDRLLSPPSVRDFISTAHFFVLTFHTKVPRSPPPPPPFRMATKRSAPSSFDDDKKSSSRPYNKRHRINTAQPHKPLPANLGNKSFKKAHSVNDLKSSIRSLRRLLNGPNSSKLPATVRSEKERALQTAEQDLKREEDAIKRDQCIGRWHKVRFFDRQKAERRLKKSKKALKNAEAEGGELEELRRKVEDGENEVNYAIYFPLDMDYVPLFPTKRKGKSEEEEKEEEKGKPRETGTGEVVRQGDDDMWQLVKKCASEGRLKDLREGRLMRASSGDGEGEEEQRTVKQKITTEGKKTEQTVKAPQLSQDEQKDGDMQSDNESGGGFFE